MQRNLIYRFKNPYFRISIPKDIRVVLGGSTGFKVSLKDVTNSEIEILCIRLKQITHQIFQGKSGSFLAITIRDGQQVTPSQKEQNKKFMTRSLRLLRCRTRSGIFRTSEEPQRNKEIKISPIQRIELTTQIQAYVLRMLFLVSIINYLPTSFDIFCRWPPYSFIVEN